MQIVSIGDSLHEMSNPVSGKSKKNISKCHLLKILPRMLSVEVRPVFAWHIPSDSDLLLFDKT